MSRAFKFALLLIALASAAFAQSHPAPPPSSWVSSWGTSQQIPEPHNALPSEDLTDATLRQIVHLSIGGPALRVHLSNAFGTEALHLTSAHIARPLSTSSPSIDPATDRAVTFAGNPYADIPPGAELISDPLDYPVASLSDLAISFHLQSPPALETGHPGSRATSWYVHGNQVSAPTFTDPKHVDHWYNITEVDVQAPLGAATIVAVGDSITDGHGATTNGNDRWTDVLAARLQASSATRNIGVSNQGIGGNHLLIDGLGPSALARFDRDVLAPSGVRWLIVFEGVNDLGGLARDGEVSTAEHAAFVSRVIAAYQQIIARAHDHGVKVFGSPILPYKGAGYWSEEGEAVREAVNRWIRTPGHFDAVVDLDHAVADKADPQTMGAAYDSGDHLHLKDAGYKAMAEAVDLKLFR